jgi:hypothetical protein
MLGREVKDMTEGERAVSYGVELVGVSVERSTRTQVPFRLRRAFGREGGAIGGPRVS